MLEPYQASSCLGSFWGSPAFMENSVFGRLRVFFSSSGSAIGLSARITPDLRTCFRALALVYRTKVLFELPVRWFSCTVRNIGKQCKHVCYNECRLVSAAGRATFPGLRESYRMGAPIYGDLRLKLRGKRCRTSLSTFCRLKLRRRKCLERARNRRFPC